MEFYIIFKDSVLPIFIIVAIAFVYNRLMKPDILQITTLTVTVFAPVFVFNELVKSNVTFDVLYKPLIFMTCLTSVLILIALLIAKLLRAGENERVALVLACSMINVGNFGLPLIYFTFGGNVSSFSVLYFVAFTIPLGTIAVYLCSREKKLSGILKDICKIPIFHGLLAALVVTELSLKVPDVIEKSFNLVGQTTIPLMIFILGLQLSSIKFRAGFIKYITPALIVRLAVSPIIAIALLNAMNISGVEKHIAVIQTSTPAALLPLMYAIRFKRSPDLLAVIIVATTLLSGFSLTVLIKLLVH